MEHLTLSWVDYTLFSILLIGSTLVGIYFGWFGRKQNTFTDYFLGGKNLAVFPVSMSLIASCLTPGALLGTPSEIYLYGIQYWMYWISWICAGVITNYIFLPVFYKLQLSTTYEYLELRFNRKVRKMASAVFVLSVVPCLPLLLYGPSLAFNQVSGFNIHLTSLVILSVCLIYTSIGGLKGVVWADTFQLCCTFGTLGLVLTMGIISVGGFSNVWQKAKLGDRLEFFNLSPDPTMRTTFWSVVLGQTVVLTSATGANPAAVQRFLSVPTLKDSKRVLTMHIVISIITKTICCFSGLILYAKYFDCDPLTSGRIKRPDQIMPYYVLDIASELPGLTGIFLSGVLSTSLSTLSTSFNTVSGIIYKDFVSDLLPATTSDAMAQSVMKGITLLIGLISIGLVFVIEYLGTIIQITNSLNGAANGPLLAMFILGMLFPMANSRGIVCGTIISFLIMSTIVVKNQMHLWGGSLTYAPKPLYTYGCNNTTLNNTEFVITTKSEETPFWLFRISFFYYSIIGCVLSIVIALPVSWLTKRTKMERRTISKDFFSPCIHRFCNDAVKKGNEQNLLHLNGNN